jgi:hypothetical protein
MAAGGVMGLAYDRRRSEDVQQGASWPAGHPGLVDYGSNGQQQGELSSLPRDSDAQDWLSDVPAGDSRELETPDWALGEEFSTCASPDGSEARREQFAAQRFERKDHVPSTGDGLFDVAYTPADGELVATLNLAVLFTHALDQWALPWLPTGWTPPEEMEAMAALMRSAQTAWTGKHTIRCVKPGWEGFGAKPRLIVNAFRAHEALAEPHYTVNLHKEKEDGQIDQDRPSVNHNWHTADFERPDLEDADIDGKVWQAEFERLSQALPTLELEPSGEQAWRLSDDNRRQLSVFSEVLQAAPPSSYRPKLMAQGWGGKDHPASAIALEGVLSELRSHAVTNKLGGTSSSNNEPGTVTFALAPLHTWPIQRGYNASAHEIGHMLGLQDEYAAADEEGHGMSEEHQALLDASGVEQHPIDADTTSIMSGGKDVMPAHYVTLWEALGAMTQGFLQPQDWKL